MNARPLMALRSVQPETHYLPHAWFPTRHGAGAVRPRHAGA